MKLSIGMDLTNAATLSTTSALNGGVSAGKLKRSGVIYASMHNSATAPYSAYYIPGITGYLGGIGGSISTLTSL